MEPTNNGMTVNKVNSGTVGVEVGVTEGVDTGFSEPTPKLPDPKARFVLPKIRKLNVRTANNTANGNFFIVIATII
jgi:hypothetical protein